MLRDASLEEPHIKLLIIDMVNYYLGLLSNEDRRTFISDLYEQQQVLDDSDESARLLKTYMSKKEDLEFRTL